MKTIEVTDRVAEIIERLRDDEEEEMAINLRLICDAFSEITDLKHYGEKCTASSQITINEYLKLIKGLAEISD